MINEELLIYFVTHCTVNLHLAYSTIKLYLAGIRNHYIQNSLGDPLKPGDSPLLKLQLILRGIRKDQIKLSRPRLPITADILWQMYNSLNSGIFGPYTDLLLQTACTMAFFGFLRCGEFTVKDKKFDPHINMTMSDIQVLYEPTLHVSVNIKVSKTDPFREGIVIYLFPTNHTLCPVSTLLKFTRVRQAMGALNNDPLFLLQEKIALSRHFFISSLRIILRRLNLDDSKYCGHSFRIGSATTSASVKIPDHLIKTLGRWSSDCYQIYIQTPKSELSEAQCLLVSRL